MSQPSAERDEKLRKVLNELSMGRLTVDEAYAQIDDLVDRPVVRSTSQAKSAGVGAGLIILLFGAVFGGVGAFMTVKSLNFSRDAGRVEGTVIRHERTGNKGNRIPIVRYEVYGKSHELRGDVGSSSPPAVNSKVAVLYKTADPNEAQIDSFVQRWLFPLVFGGIGGLVLLVGLVVLIQGIANKVRAAVSSAGSERFTV
jgi:hypothetical protein